jgi:hypothetical protein
LVTIITILFYYIPQDRFAMVRRSRFKFVRQMYQAIFILYFAYKLESVCSRFTDPQDELQLFEGGRQILNDILTTGPDTYQKKHTNLLQIESLMECVSNLIPLVSCNGVKPVIIDIGAGKALLTRALYEAFHRQISVVALDNRPTSRKDEFYDPVTVGAGEAPYTRIVADVRDLADRTLGQLQTAGSNHLGGAIAITKHLCGGATDSSIISLCEPPLQDFIGGCCLAPCCHQKIKKNQYCNVDFLQSHGFCSTHIGVRGGVQDNDFRTFGILISISKMNVSDLVNCEFKNSQMLAVLGFARCQELGRLARRLLEEGRMNFLRKHGYECQLVRYCDENVANDNLAIIATRKTMRREKYIESRRFAQRAIAK